MLRKSSRLKTTPPKVVCQRREDDSPSVNDQRQRAVLFYARVNESREALRVINSSRRAKQLGHVSAWGPRCRVGPRIGQDQMMYDFLPDSD